MTAVLGVNGEPLKPAGSGEFVTGHDATGALSEARPQMLVGKGDRVIEYVGGPHPYYWIGSAAGEFFGAVSASDLRRFVTAPNKWQEPSETEE